MSNLPWDEKPYIDFSKRFNYLNQEVFKEALERALPSEVEDKPVVEFFDEGNSILTVKIRGRWNDWLQGLYTEYVPFILRKVRTFLNVKGFKQCKVQCSIHEADPEKNNIRIIYNPNWRRYENYEIFFRNKTQSRRTKRY